MKTTYIIKALIDEIKEDPSIKAADETSIIIKEICDKIQEQEDQKCSDEELVFNRQNAPSGASIYLTLPIPPQRDPKEYSYITLEFDALTGWSVGYYIDFGKTGKFKLRKRHDVKYDNPNTIMTEFGKIYKAYLGKQAITLNSK